LDFFIDKRGKGKYKGLPQVVQRLVLDFGVKLSKLFLYLTLLLLRQRVGINVVGLLSGLFEQMVHGNEIIYPTFALFPLLGILFAEIEPDLAFVHQLVELTDHLAS
jgi:hypothetical protein